VTHRLLSSGSVLALAVACSHTPGEPSPPPQTPTAATSPGPRPAAASAAEPAPHAEAPANATFAKTGQAPSLPEVPEEMAAVPGGEFVMGSDVDGELDERPAHRVALAPFLLDRTEVTNRAYGECVQAGVCKPPQPVAKSFQASDKDFRGELQPVVGVSWFDAKAYCQYRSKRLPREAEWERAARADDNRRYAWGNEPPDPLRLACYGRKPSAPGGATMPVGSYPDGRGAFGHLDLTGNVWEWVEDVYDPYAYRRSSAAQGQPGSCDEVLKTQDELRASGQNGFTGKNPIPNVCERVLRGGAFNYRGDGLRVTNRVHHPPEWHILVAGFRCARDL
jgi:formylglycine-generating enzyme required for sulfatase activity